MRLLNLPGLLLSTVLFLQGTPAQPVRLGHMADRVTAADVAQIAALVLPPQTRPWVLVSSGPPFIESMPWFVDVFLEPARATQSLRRGRMITVKTTTPAEQAYQGLRVWQVERYWPGYSAGRGHGRG